MKRYWVLLFVLLFLSCAQQTATTDEVLYYENRSEIPVEYTWNLEDIFPSVEAFNEAFAETDALIEAVNSHRGHLGQSASELSSALEDMFRLQEHYGELDVYAGQFFDSNGRSDEANEMFNRVNGLSASISQATAYVEPEISAISTNRLRQFMRSSSLAPYQHYLDNIIRLKPHIASGEVEEVLASANLLARNPRDTYGQLVTSDIEWPMVRGEDGTESRITPALYYSFVASQDRRVRREAALALFGTYSQFANTFAGTYGGHVQRDIFLSRNRGYERSVDMGLDANNIPYAVIETLIGTVHDNFELMHRYVELRKEVLGIDDFHVYDMYVNLVAEGDRHVSYEEGKQLALDFWRETYGEEYYNIGVEAFDNRWIDVYACDGKRGGAYSWGTYNSHPYMLLNWGGTLEDVFTLVHEMGHSIHSHLANTNQPFHSADYSLFVAEVAAVTSEALFLDYMLDQTDDETERLFLLNMYLNNITGTFLRQIFFTEFELRAHEMAENSEPFTAATLGDMYGELWQQYYGPNLVLDDEFKAGWSRIPHFYRTFYVYVYASSFAAGEAIAQRVREGDATGVDDYLNMLKLGGSVYPMDALQAAGVDMTNPEVIRTVMSRYGETLSEMERILGN